MQSMNSEADYAALQHKLTSGYMYSRRLYQAPCQVLCTQPSPLNNGTTLLDKQTANSHVTKNDP